MLRTTFAVVLAVFVSAPAVSFAHKGNPNMESIVRSVNPKTKGISLAVLNREDRFELINHSGKPIVIYGYNNEPYARLLADGSVEVNTRSPAYHLNDDRFGQVTVPKSADAKAAPVWKKLDGDGRFQWHDHRMHYMGQGTPPSVKDKSKRQKVFDYSIPIKIGTATGAIDGTLLWTPQKDGGPPVGAIVGFVLLLLASGAVVVTARRRREKPEGEKAEW